MLKRTLMLLWWPVMAIGLIPFSVADGQQPPDSEDLGSVGIMASSGNNQVIAVRYTDTRIASRIDLFDAATGTFLTSGDLEPFAPMSMDLSPTGDRLLWADATGNIGIYDFNTLSNMIIRRGGEGSAVSGVDWSAGSELVGWTEGAGAKLYEVAAARNLVSMNSGQGRIGELAISETGTQVLMSRYRNSLEDMSRRDSFSTEIWDVPVVSDEFQLLRSPALRIEDVGGYAVAWSPDSQRIAVGEESGFAIYEPGTGALIRVPVEGIRPYMLAWSPDGSTLATGGDVQFWDTATWQLANDMGFYTTDLEWAPDSEHIYNDSGPGGTLAVNEMTLAEWQEVQAVTPTPTSTLTPTPTPTPSAYQKLRLTSLCSANPVAYRLWRRSG